MEGNFQFGEVVGTAFINAGGLAGGADELVGEEVGKAGMVLPVGDEAAEQVGAAQKGTGGGTVAADRDVCAAAGADGVFVPVLFAGAEATVCGGFVDGLVDMDKFFPGLGGVDVDFDDAGVRGDLEALDALVAGRSVAFELDGNLQMGSSGFDRVNQH